MREYEINLGDVVGFYRNTWQLRRLTPRGVWLAPVKICRGEYVVCGEEKWFPATTVEKGAWLIQLYY